MTEQHEPINAVPVTATGESAPQLDESKSNIPMMSNDLKQFLEYERRSFREADEAARRDPALRLAMVELITDLGDMIGNTAAKLAYEKGLTSAWDIDNLADKVCWQIVEFLAQGSFERDPAEAPICKAYQVSERHAMDWFDVGIPSTGGKPFALESEQKS